MPDGVAEAIEPDDFEWHDGNLVDLQLLGLPGEQQELRLTLDIYVDRDPQTERKRFSCVGIGLRRYLASGDVGRISRASHSGNIEYARMNYTDESEILTVILFGGMIEVEATRFEFTEEGR
jgi:hypothetical protein